MTTVEVIKSGPFEYVSNILDKGGEKPLLLQIQVNFTVDGVGHKYRKEIIESYKEFIKLLEAEE